MKNERGITVVSLIITIIVMILLATTAISVGMNTYKTSQREAFVLEMQLIQGKVDEIVAKDGGSNILGSMNSLISPSQQDILTTAYRNQEITSNNYLICRHFSQGDLKTYFGLENMKYDVIINFATREVISMIGIEFLGNTYYTQYKLPGGQAITNKVATPRTIENLIKTKVMDGLNATIIISNISITNGTLSYKEENDTYWTTITNYTHLRNT